MVSCPTVLLCSAMLSCPTIVPSHFSFPSPQKPNGGRPTVNKEVRAKANGLPMVRHSRSHEMGSAPLPPTQSRRPLPKGCRRSCRPRCLMQPIAGRAPDKKKKKDKTRQGATLRLVCTTPNKTLTCICIGTRYVNKTPSSHHPCCLRRGNGR